jgi:hypothetical protein
LGSSSRKMIRRKWVAAGDENLIGYGRYMGEEVLKERQDWAAK